MEFNDNVYNIIGLLIILLINYIKTRSFTKKAFKGLDDKVDGLTIVVTENINQKEFRTRLSNVISQKAYNIISANTQLDKGIISTLNLAHIKIRNFAVNYFDSQYRVDKNIIEGFIEISMDTIQEAVKNAAQALYEGEKNDMEFCDFVLKETNIEIVVNTFKQRLLENGMNDEQYIFLYEKLIRDYFKEFIKGWTRWVRI